MKDSIAMDKFKELQVLQPSVCRLRSPKNELYMISTEGSSCVELDSNEHDMSCVEPDSLQEV